MSNLEDTKKHIKKVREFLDIFKLKIDERKCGHDHSKLEPPEAELFAKYEDRLKDVEYDSNEYWEMMDELEPAIEHHYKYNRHHPDCHPHGIRDMNLVDIVEMFFDWWAASQRHDDGDIKESIEKNRERFLMSDDLVQIFKNTVEDLEGEIETSE